MKRAYVTIRPAPHYRADAFCSGLKRLGFEITRGAFKGGPNDVMLTWNLYGAHERYAAEFKAGGGRLLVAENGYLGVDENKHMLFAMARDGHNGSGSWPMNGDDRFGRLGIEVKPWRHDRHGHVVIAAQRGIGTKQMASPYGWDKHADNAIRKGGRRTMVRAHPGKPATRCGEEITRLLKGAYCAAIWSSGLGVRALVEGVPVHYSAPFWICSDAAKQGLDIQNPVVDDALRSLALQKMSHAQWTLAEIESGMAFDRLLGGVDSSWVGRR